MAGNTGKVVVLEKSPYEILDQETSTFLEYLKQSYTSWGSNPRVSSILSGFLQKCANPYVSVLKLMYCCGTFHSCKAGSLPIFIINTFNSWLQSNKEVEEQLEPYVKLDAMRLILEQKNLPLRNAVIRAYQMTSESLIFVPLIQELISRKHYKDACQTVAALKLHGSFTPEDFLVPLYLQDKIIVIEEYVHSDADSLKKFISYLDNLLTKDDRSYYDIINRLEIREFNASKCSHKPLTKLMARLAKTHNLPPEATPNLMIWKKRGALQFLLAKRFSSLDYSIEGWKEMAIEAVQESADLQLDLVRALVDQGCAQEALAFARRFQLPVDLWPPDLKSLELSPSTSADSNSDHSAANLPTNSSTYLSLPFSDDKIILVDDAVPLVRFLEALSSASIVGIDCEWKPSFGLQESDLSLIQIATSDEVYVLDRPSLAQNVADFVTIMLDNFFHNKDILKIGFHIDSDLKALKKSFTGLKQIQNLLDIGSLWGILRDEYNFQFPKSRDPENAPSKGKLKDLVELTLGKTLNKTEQFSNWELRPLRQEQLQYAAIDAYCLISVYSELESCCRQQDIPMSDIVKGLIRGRSEREWLTESVPAAPTSKSVTDVHVICTWELWPLVLKLRNCGIDAEYINRRYPTKENQKLIFKGYVILSTLGQPWLQRNMTAIMVPVAEVKVQLQHVLSQMKIEVLQQNIGTRCLDCNSEEVLPMDGEQLRNIHDMALIQQNTVLPYDPYEAEETGYDSDDNDDYYEEEAPEQQPPPQEMPSFRTSRGAMIKADKMPEVQRETCQLVFVCQECGSVQCAASVEEVFTD